MLSRVSGFCAPGLCPLPFVSVEEKYAGLKSGVPKGIAASRTEIEVTPRCLRTGTLPVIRFNHAKLKFGVPRAFRRRFQGVH